MNTYNFITKAGQMARCLLLVCLVSFIFPTTGWGKIYFLDNFNTEDPKLGWEEFDEEEPDLYSIANGLLRITAGLNQDLWQDTWKRGAPLLLRNVPAQKSYYSVETHVRASIPSSLELPSQPENTQIGLFLFWNINTWMFFGLTNHGFDSTPHTNDGLLVTKTFGGSSSIVAGIDLTEDFVFLKIEKELDKTSGNTLWKFFWKLHDADDYVSLTSFELNLSATHKAGLGVKTFQGADEGEGNFDFFKISVFGPPYEPEPQKPIKKYYEEWSREWPWEIVVLVLLGFAVLLFFLVRRILNRRK